MDVKPKSPSVKYLWLLTIVCIAILHSYSRTYGAVSEPILKVEQTSLQILHNGQAFDISLNCPTFIFSNISIAEGTKPVSMQGDIKNGEPLTVSFDPIALDEKVTMEVQLLLQWSSDEKILRKWARYRLSQAPENLVLQEIILDSIDRNVLLADPIIILPQSFPAFAKGFFLGIEFPVASTRVEGQNLILGHKPGLRIQDTQWHESRRAIYGIAAVGEEQNAFGDYITGHRPKPKDLHINYNSWWSAAGTTEDTILALMKQFHDNMTKPYGVSFDSFTIDHGWSELKSIWEISPSVFPNSFRKVQDAAESSGAALGLWSSPACMYVGAFDTTWAMEQGYETFQSPSIRLSCIGGERYQNAYAAQLCKLATQYNIKQFKFDGFALTCPESDHGHEPDELSTEMIAQGGIDTFQAVHKAAPEAWLEATCFSWGGVGSPWWLFYVNSVTGAFGDDAPTGRVPCPIYRESYTSGRDYFNLQGASLSPIPISAQEVLGIIHQSKEPFLNDGVVTVMRGHSFLPLYVNPVHMDKDRWFALAKLLSWARTNSDIILKNTYPLLPASWLNGQQPKFTHMAKMPAEIYGYAHCKDNYGLVAVRNPWINPQTYTLKLDGSIGFDLQAKEISVVSLYPETRVYGQNLNYGDTFTFPIAPYETIVLSIKSDQETKDIPSVKNLIRKHIKINVTKSEAKDNFAIEIKAFLNSTAPQTKLLVLAEGPEPLADPTYKLSIDGKPVEMQTISSETGFNATGIKEREHWLYMQAELPSKCKITLEVKPGGNSENISVWVWGTKEGSGMSDFTNALPSPEIISLDAVSLGNFYCEQAWMPSPHDNELMDGESKVLSWKPGHKVISHDVYFGTELEAVQAANRDSAEYRGNQPAEDTDWDMTEFNKAEKHFWRIDEVYTDKTVKGQVWSFVNFSGEFISGSSIIATASSAIQYMEPIYLINLAGLKGDVHDTIANSSAWLSLMEKGTLSSASPTTTIGETWVKFELDSAYILEEMLVWNYNVDPVIRGLKKVYIEYSIDGVNWSKLMDGDNDFWTFAKAPGIPSTPTNIVDFNGSKAKFVVFTVPAGGDGQWGGDGHYGLSEIRFSGKKIPEPGIIEAQ